MSKQLWQAAALSEGWNHSMSSIMSAHLIQMLLLLLLPSESGMYHTWSFFLMPPAPCLVPMDK